MSAPTVSIGLPVRNGEVYIRRVLDSLLAQDFPDLEIVICDNASDDSTPDIVRDYASSDPRVKLHHNERDLGQIVNMNRVFELASGKYFRWIGVDDWVEPTYVSRCVEALDRNPDWIGVSVYIKYFDDHGNEHYAEYEGERFESPKAHERFARMLWFLQADYRYTDSHYGMYRREALEKTRLCQLTYLTDRVLAAELSLLGPIGHIPECLAYRRREPTQYIDRKAVNELYYPDRPEALEQTPLQLCLKFEEAVNAADLTAVEKAHCRRAIAQYFVKAELKLLNRSVRSSARRVPGYGIARTVLRR